MTQRAGRMIRQGNDNDKVHLYRYVTENTFDAYLFQTLEVKQKFIGQIMTSKAPVRSCEDFDEQALSYAEVKALCAGNPLVKEKMDLDVSLTKLKVLKANHQNEIYKLQDMVYTTLPTQIASVKSRIAGLEKDISQMKKYPTMTDSDGKEKFYPMKVDGKIYYDKEDAGKALKSACVKSAVGGNKEPLPIGEYKGFEMTARFDTFSQAFTVDLKGAVTHSVELGSSESGNITRLNNALDSLDKKLTESKTQLETLEMRMESAKSEMDKPFPQEKELSEQLARLEVVTARLTLDSDKNTPKKSAEKSSVSSDKKAEEVEKKESVLGKLRANQEKIKGRDDGNAQKDVPLI